MQRRRDWRRNHRILTARELLLSGWSVTVLEGMHIGAGSSSRTAAGIRQQFSTRSTVIGMRYSVDFYKAFQSETEANQSPIVQNGYLFLYDNDANWQAAQRRVAMQHGAGLSEVMALGPEDLAERFSWVDRDVIQGGTWCPTDGFLHPALVYQDGARRVRELGGKIVQRAPVTGADLEGGRITAVTTAKGRAHGDLFIDCTNAWTTQLALAIDATPLPVSPLKRYLWFVKRDGGMSGGELMDMPLVIAPSGVYGRPENPDTLLMGWAHDTRPELGFTDADQDYIEPHSSHDTGIDTLFYEAWMQLAEAVPPIGEFAVMATTAGYYGSTPDHNLFLGYDLGGPTCCDCGLRHGAMFGPFTARVAAAKAEAGRDLAQISLPQGDVDLADFSVRRDLSGHAESMVI